MKEIINKLMAIEKETSEEKGEYNLFALFLREDSFINGTLLFQQAGLIIKKMH